MKPKVRHTQGRILPAVPGSTEHGKSSRIDIKGSTPSRCSATIAVLQTVRSGALHNGVHGLVYEVPAHVGTELSLASSNFLGTMPFDQRRGPQRANRRRRPLILLTSRVATRRRCSGRPAVSRRARPHGTV
jgi:hypothetical protein